MEGRFISIPILPPDEIEILRGKAPCMKVPGEAAAGTWWSGTDEAEWSVGCGRVSAAKQSRSEPCGLSSL